MRALAQDYAAAVAARDMRAVIRANKTFHQAVYGHCRNDFLFSMIDQMAQRANLVRFSSSMELPHLEPAPATITSGSSTPACRGRQRPPRRGMRRPHPTVAAALPGTAQAFDMTQNGAPMEPNSSSLVGRTVAGADPPSTPTSSRTAPSSPGSAAG
ncbi:MAG: hypothetical protein AcusKO_21520 [Acuticoccus sp.]